MTKIKARRLFFKLAQDLKESYQDNIIIKYRGGFCNSINFVLDEAPHIEYIEFNIPHLKPGWTNTFPKIRICCKPYKKDSYGVSMQSTIYHSHTTRVNENIDLGDKKILNRIADIFSKARMVDSL